VANHPNSFLDAIIIATQFSEPVYFLARGDAFRKPWHRFLLRLLHMVPIYRLSEGRENLHMNNYAFKQSQELLAAGKIVLIFIEGICLNTHQLQPFKKGAARIALTAVAEKLDLNIMPLSVSYNSFTRFGKQVRVELSTPIPAAQLLPYDQEALNMQHFNREIFSRLNNMIFEPASNVVKSNNLFLPLSVLGHFLHWPLYRVIKNIILQKTRQTVFYDSVLFGALLLCYPLYLILLLILFAFVHLQFTAIAIILLLHPVSAWVAVRNKIMTGSVS